jgi:hypothetical protein
MDEMTASLLHRTFAHRETGEWPDELHVDTVAHERSRFAAQSKADAKALALHLAQGTRRWRGTARNVIDENGVEHLMSAAPPRAMPEAKRLSLLAAKADEIADIPGMLDLPRNPPVAPIGEVKCARLLRPVLFAVGALCAKSERAGVRDARAAKRKAVEAAWKARVDARPITHADAADALGLHRWFHVGQVVEVDGALRRVTR